MMERTRRGSSGSMHNDGASLNLGDRLTDPRGTPGTWDGLRASFGLCENDVNMTHPSY
jgi:hypothetical protein